MKTFTDIGGFDSLRWEDQEKVKGKVGGGGSKGSEAAAAASNGVSDDLQVEYAKSKRSKCKNCKEQIDKVRPCSSYMYLCNASSSYQWRIQEGKLPSLNVFETSLHGKDYLNTP